MDVDDAQQNASVLEGDSGKDAGWLHDGCAMLVALVQETDEDSFGRSFSKFETEILRRDAAAIAMEVEEAQELEKEKRRLAKGRMCRVHKYFCRACQPGFITFLQYRGKGLFKEAGVPDSASQKGDFKWVMKECKPTI